MKSVGLLFTIIIFPLSGTSVFAQITEQPDLAYVIVASKNGIERKYKAGTRLLIKYNNGNSKQKARGYFAGVEEEKIAIFSKKATGKAILISPDSVLLLRKIRPTQRIIFATIGMTLIGGGAAILDKASNTSGNSGAAVLIIPVIGAGVYFLWAVPVSLLIEKINEKKKDKGWTFLIKRLK